MTAPRFAPCRCTHTKADHETDGLAPQCTARTCTCLQYRPAVAVAAKPTTSPIPPARPAAVVVPIGPSIKDDDMPPTDPAPTANAPTVDQLVAAGKRSTTRRTVTLAEKVETLTAELRGRLADERKEAEDRARREAEQAETRRKIADLEAQLAAARSVLGAGPRVADQTCPECGKGGLSNLGVHRARKHGFTKAG